MDLIELHDATSEKLAIVRSSAIFILGVTVAHIIRYYTAGAIAVLASDLRQYYPPSPAAIP